MIKGLKLSLSVLRHRVCLIQKPVGKRNNVNQNTPFPTGPNTDDIAGWNNNTVAFTAITVAAPVVSKVGRKLIGTTEKALIFERAVETHAGALKQSGTIYSII